MESHLASLEVFYGELTPNRAVVQARLPGAVREDLSLSGTIRGPRCSQGSTLPATYRLVGQVSNLSHPDSGQVGNLSYAGASALITEPVFWTPDWPALYDVTVELRRGSEIIDQATQAIGLKSLSVLGKGFDFGGKFWILRGVERQGQLDLAINECREHAAALVAPAELLDERLLMRASEEGVLVVAQLAKAKSHAAELSRLSRFATVAIAAVPPGQAPVRSVTPSNILLAHRVEQGRAEPPKDDARLVVAEVFDPWIFGDWASKLARTVIAYRPLEQTVDVAAARAECDRLQRDLAHMGQYAGYIV